MVSSHNVYTTMKRVNYWYAQPGWISETLLWIKEARLEENIVYNSTYMKFKNKQNKSMVSEARIVGSHCDDLSSWNYHLCMIQYVNIQWEFKLKINIGGKNPGFLYSKNKQKVNFKKKWKDSTYNKISMAWRNKPKPY